MPTSRLVVNIALNMAEFRQQLAQGLQQLATTKTALEQMSRAFSGESIIRQAGAVVQSIENIGGVTKLTAAEQRRVNAIVSEAIEKYRALGQAVPPELQQIQAQTAQNTSLTERWLGKLDLLVKGWLGYKGLMLVKHLLNEAAALTDLAVKTGFSVEALQRLRVVAEQWGISLDTVTTAAARLAARLGAGEDSVRAAVGALGLSFDQLRRAPMEQAFLGVLEAVQKLGPTTQEAAAAMKALFGKSGIELLPLLAADLTRVRDGMAGVAVMSTATAERLDRLSDLLVAIKQIAVAVGASLLDWVARGLATVVAVFQSFVSGVVGAGEKLARLAGFTALADQLNAVRFTYQKATEDSLNFARGISTTAGAHQAMQPAARASAETLGELMDRLKEGEERAKQHAEAVRKLREEIGGDRLQGDVRKLVTVWQQLSREGKLTDDTLRRLGKAAQALLKDHAKLPEDFRRAIPVLEATNLSYTLMATSVLPAVRDRTIELRRVVSGLTDNGLIPAGEGMKGVMDELLKAPLVIGPATKELEALRAEFTGLRDEMVGPFGAAIQSAIESIPQFIQAAFTGGGGLLGALRAIVSKVGSELLGGLFAGGPTGTAFGQWLERLARALPGAIGKTLAAVLPGIGAAIGALAGPIIESLVGAFRKPEWKKVIGDVGRDLGLTLSEGLAKTIAEDSKRLGDRVAATLLNLGKIVDDAGGVMAFGLDKAIAKTRDLFVMIETGKLTAREAGRAFEEMFAKLLPEAIDKTTGLAKASFVELVRLADRFGVGGEGVARFINEQARAVLGGLKTFVANATVTSQQAADAMANAAVGAFAVLRQQGASLPEALKAVDEVFAALAQQFTAAGFVGGEAFERIRSLAALARDEVAGPALQAVDGLRASLVGLANLGLLNQDTFAGLARQVADTFGSLVAKGLDGNQVMLLMQPTLQTLWELQRRFGFQIDETTAALLAQAEQAGVVGEQHRSAMDRAADAMLRVAEALEALIKGTQGFSQALREIPTDIVVHGRVEWDAGNVPAGGGPPVAMQHGGIVMRPTLALLGERGPEAVIPLNRAAAPMEIQVHLDGRQVAALLVPYLPGAVRSYRVG